MLRILSAVPTRRVPFGGIQFLREIKMKKMKIYGHFGGEYGIKPGTQNKQSKKMFLHERELVSSFTRYECNNS